MDTLTDLFAGAGGGDGDSWAYDPMRALEQQRRPTPVFFAITPDPDSALDAEQTAHRLRLENRLTGAVCRRDMLHVSVLGIGWRPDLREEKIEAACAAAAAVAMPPFTVAFDRAASFGGGANRPLVLCGGDGVAGILMLRRALIAGLKKVGVDVKKTHYEPHMTLLYDRRPIMGQFITPVRWKVREFSLIHSLHGAATHVCLAHWTLRGR